MTKTFGNMTSDEKRAAVKSAVSKLQAELNNPAVKAAIGKVLADFDAEHAPKLFYLWLNLASERRHYWSQPAQAWVAEAKDATRFATHEQATAELPFAYKTTQAEVIIDKADPAKLRALEIEV